MQNGGDTLLVGKRYLISSVGIKIGYLKDNGSL